MAKFPIYLPYRPELTEFVMKQALTDLLLLDIQLGSTCNARCPRCDSACCDLDEPADVDIGAVVTLVEQMQERLMSLEESQGAGNVPYSIQGFICGLGEPTAGPNLQKLKELLRQTADLGVTWSIFTNNIYWDDELDAYLKSGKLSVMIQCNSCKPGLVAETMGVGPERAAMHLRNRMHLRRLARESEIRLRSGGKYTNIAASIVPDRDNLDEIPDLVAEDVECGIFPLIAELENAGHSKGEYYERHKLHVHELRTLYSLIERRFGVSYEIPVCPATIGAIHVNNHNAVTVDEFTGLACGWFGMGDPKVREIGDIRKMKYREAADAILDYRRSRIHDVKESIAEYPEMVFGGCGGNARQLLTRYAALYD